MGLKTKLLGLGSGLALMLSNNVNAQEPKIQVNYVFSNAGSRSTPNLDGFFKITANGTSLYNKRGDVASGFNSIEINKDTGDLVTVRNFDTMRNVTKHYELCDYLNSVQESNYVYIGISKDGGLTWGSMGGDPCEFINDPSIKNTIQTLKNLGSQKIENYCNGDTWAMLFQKGSTNPPLYEYIGTYNSASYQFGTEVEIIHPRLEPRFKVVRETFSSPIMYAEVLVHGPAAVQYNVQVSTDLTNWNNATTWATGFDTMNACVTKYKIINSPEDIGNKYFKVDRALNTTANSFDKK